MKKLVLSLVVFTVLFVTGCQDNSITDPVSNETISKNAVPPGSVTHGTIPLEDILVFPGMGQTYYSLRGRINYTHEMVLLDPIPPAPQFYIDLNFSINAVLTNYDLTGNSTWTITSMPTDVICYLVAGSYQFQHSFPVQGRKDGLELVCNFLVTTDGMELTEMWLAVHEDKGMNKNVVQPDTITYPQVLIDVVQ